MSSRAGARRVPPGWVPHGPEPGPAREVAPLEADETRAWLCGDWTIRQRRGGHRWSLDDLVTAWVASELGLATGATSHLDLGCGIGSVALLVAWRLPWLRTVGVEAQAASARLARASVAELGLGERITIVDADLRAWTPGSAGSFSLVSGTPPYVAPAATTSSPDPQRAACRTVLRGDALDYLAAADRLAARDAAMALCVPPPTTPAALAGLTARGWEIVTRLAVVPKLGRPVRFSVLGAVRGRARATRWRGTLTVRDGQDRRTPEMMALRHAMGLPP